MFGITVATLNKHGLANEILDSFRLWKELTPELSPSNKSISKENSFP